MLAWIIVVVVVLILAALYLEIYFYEGVHLGPRIQARLYDQWAASYDRDKEGSQRDDARTLARPLLDALGEAPAGAGEPLVLDVATGTGRLPHALLEEPGFTGRVIALDISHGMLLQAAAKLSPYGERVRLVQQPALPLPFPADTFDAVCCLEALELMPDVEAPLRELARVLQPGGVLLTSRGREASGRVGQVYSVEKFTRILQAAGFEQVQILPWWKKFDRVWALKPGRRPAAPPRTLADVLLCPACGAPALAESSGAALRCGRCGAEVPIGPEGIVLYGAAVP